MDDPLCPRIEHRHAACMPIISCLGGAWTIESKQVSNENVLISVVGVAIVADCQLHTALG